MDNSGSFKYEPKYNGGFNPECSFICSGKTVNIEVKCPHMGTRIEIESHATLKIAFAERMPNNFDFTTIIKELNQIVSPRLEKRGY